MLDQRCRRSPTLIQSLIKVLYLLDLIDSEIYKHIGKVFFTKHLFNRQYGAQCED